MREVCRFYGIIIRFYYREHPPTHFHAIYGEHEALIEIETGDARVPRRSRAKAGDSRASLWLRENGEREEGLIALSQSGRRHFSPGKRAKPTSVLMNSQSFSIASAAR